MRHLLSCWGIGLWVCAACGAATTPISLAPADWGVVGSVSGSYTKVATAEGYLRITATSYRGSVRLGSNTHFNLQAGATLRYKWRVYAANQYGAYSHGVDGISSLGRFMSTHHSWAGSNVVQENRWIYTQVEVTADKQLVYSFCYDDYGAALIHGSTINLNDAQYAALADAYLSMSIGDNYYAGTYIDVAEASVESGMFVTVVSPTSESYVAAGSEVTLTAEGENGSEPYEYSWTSDLDGELGTGDSIAATLSRGTHVITVTCTDASLEQTQDSVTVHAIDAPVLEAVADVTISSGGSYTGPTPVLASGDGPLTWSLADGPEGMEIDPATGVVTWSFPLVSEPPYDVRVGVENPVGSDEVSWHITVIEASSFVNPLWPRVYDGLGGTDGHDSGSRTVIDHNGDIVVAGYIDGVAGEQDAAFLAKYSATGELLWQKVVSMPPAAGKAEHNDRFTNVAVDSENNIIVVGVKSGTWSGYYLGSYHNAWWVQKYTPDGQTLLWEIVWHDGSGSAWQSAYGVAVDDQDNIYVTGNSFGSWSGPEHQWITFKYDKDGHVLWGPIRANFVNHYYLQDISYGIAVDSQGDCVVAGMRGVSGTDGGIYNNYDWHVRKYRGTDGGLLWQDTYDEAGRADYARSVAVDGNDDVLVVGYVNKGADNSTNGNYDWYAVKYSSAGAGGVGERLWTVRYESAAGRSEVCYDVACDEQDDFVLCGYLRDASDVIHGRLAKLRGVDGVTSGEYLAPSERNLNFIGLDLAGQRIAVTGSLDSATDRDVYTALFSSELAVLIQTPQSHSSWVEGDPITFAAEATGPAVTPYSFYWHSDRDGDLGSGSVLETSALSLGQHLITVLLEQGNGEILESSIIVNVLAVPEIVPITDVVIGDESAWTGAPLSAGADAEPVTWSLLDGPQGMTIDSDTGELAWADPVEGEYDVTIRADNPASQDEATFLLTVRALPDLVAIEDGSVLEGQAYTVQLGVLKGSEPLTWSLVEGPAEMTLDPDTGYLAWPAAVPSMTPFTVRVRVENDMGADEQAWSLLVLSPPLIQPMSNATVNEGETYASPRPGLAKGTAPVTWSLLSAPAGMQIDPASGIVSWTSAVAEGSPFEIAIQADNAYGNDTKSFTLTVIQPPQIGPIADAEVVEGQAYALQPLLSQGSSPISWRLAQAPAGMTIDPATGMVGWTAGTAQGPHTVSVEATNAAGSHSRTWRLTVHVLPELAPLPNAEIAEGDAYALAAPTLLKGSEPILYSLAAGPGGMSVDPQTGALSWNPTHAEGSPFTIALRAANSWGSDEVSFTLRVIRPPILAAISDASITKGVTYVGLAPMLTQGTLPVDWTLADAPQGMTVDGNGVVRWPGSPVAGTHEITLRVANLAGFDERTWRLDVIAPPIIADMADASVPELTAFLGAVPQLIEGTPPIQWSLVAGPGGMTIDETSGVVSWASAQPSLPAIPVRIRAANAVGSDEAAFLLTVLSPPAIQPVADQRIAEGRSWSSPLPVLSKGTSPVEWSLRNAPAGMTIDVHTGAVTWPQPAANQNGYTVTSVAQNDYGEDERAWNLQVVQAPQLAAVDDIALVEGTSYTQPLELTAGSEPVQWSLVQAPAGMTINQQGLVVWSAPPQEGPHPVTARASNLAGEADVSWQVTVRVLPQIAALPDGDPVEGEPYTSPAPVLIKGTEPVEYSLVTGPGGMTIDPQTGVVHWAQTSANGNPHTVTIEAANEWGAARQTWHITVVRTPVIAAIADAAVARGQAYVGRTPALSDGTYPVVWELIEYPEGMTINSKGVVYWPSANSQDAPHTITIRAGNAAGSGEQSWSLDVLIPPQIEAISAQQAYEMTPFTLTPHTVEGTEPIAWSLLNGPDGMTIDAATGALSWSDPDPIGAPHSVSIEARNWAGRHVRSFVVNVATAYTVQVRTDVDEAAAGTVVPIRGEALWTDGAPAANVPVDIRIEVKGSRRTYHGTSGPDGQVNYTFRPLASEAGRFQIYGQHPAIQKADPDDEFTLYGVRLATSRQAVILAPGKPLSNSVDLRNLGDIPVGGLGAHVVGLPPNWQVELGVPEVLAPGETAQLEYTLTAGDASLVFAEVQFVVTGEHGVASDIIVGADVRVQVPSIKAHPRFLQGTMVRGQATQVKLSLFNEGAAATGPLEIQLPAADWLHVAAGGRLDPLDPGEEAEVWLTLAPPPDLPLGPYSGALNVVGPYSGAQVDFEFHAVSEARGDLLVRAEDEFTYYAEGEPLVAGAAVTVIDSFTGEVAASGVTDASGELLLTDLPESYYRVRVQAEKHRDYTAAIAILPGRTKILAAFLPRQLVTYTWKVEPTFIEDRYEFILETTYETNVPVPVVTVEPAVFDLDQIGNGSMQVDYTITNHGLIAAEDAWFDFGDNSQYTFTPLVEEIGAVPAQSSITVPVLIERRPAQAAAAEPLLWTDDIETNANAETLLRTPPPASTDKCKEVTAAGVYYTLVCGENNRLKLVPVRFEYKRSCPDTKPNKFFPHSTPQEETETEKFLRDLADYMFGGGGGGGGGGEITTTLRRIFGQISNYIAQNLPDVTVPPSSELGIPCDQCSFNVGKALVGGISDNIPALKKIKCTASLSYEAGVVIRRCSYLGLFDMDCLRAIYDVVSKVKKGCGVPKDSKELEESIKASLKEIVKVALKHCVGVDWAPGPGAPPPPSGDNMDETMLRIIELNDRIEAVDQSILALFGDPVWVDTDPADTDAVNAWLDQFGLAIAADSDGGVGVTETEWEDLSNPAIQPIPQSIGLVKIDAFILRWNRTVDYIQEGVLTSNDLPDGWDPDFIALDILDEKVVAAADAAQATIDEGYDDFFEPVVEAIEQAQELVNDNDEGICAKVKIQIRQEAVLTRAAFEATLEINNASAAPLEDLAVYLEITDALGNDANDLFVVLPPYLTGISDVSGDGVIDPGLTASAEWTIVPTPDAAVGDETTYYVGGRFSYRTDGSTVSMPLMPDDIIVRPDASLQVRYFHQKTVFSDDPFTDEVEPAEPFSLGLMMTNSGRGTAYRVSMTSAQPQIVENEKGLLVDFEILASQVGEEPVSPSLAVYLGDIHPGQTAVARWLMQSSLQGEFTDYKASYVHLDGLGDSRLSLIDSVSIHELIHAVRADHPVEDGVYDFLVNDVQDEEALPDTLYLSDGGIADVFVAADADVDAPATPNSPQVSITADLQAGYNYIALPDPSDGAMTLAVVTRSDGKLIRLADNAWTTRRTIRKQGEPPREEKLLHIFDDRPSAGPVSYEVLFTQQDSPLVVQSIKGTNDPLDAVEITFSRPIDPDTFDWHDLHLTRNGGLNLLYQPPAIRRLTDVTYRVSGLALLTYPAGEYRLRVDATGILTQDGNPGLAPASVQWRRTLTPWNIDSLGVVDLADFAVLAEHWLQTGCAAPVWCGGADLDRNTEVTIEDLLLLAEHWLQ